MTNNAQSDDTTLMLRVRRGDAAALTELYARLGQHVMALAWRLLGDQQAAREVLHATFAQLTARSQCYRPELGTPRAFIYALARKEALCRMRECGQQPHLSEAGSLLGESGGLPQSALDHLPERDQLLLRDAFFLELGHDEAAQAAGQHTLKSRMNQALSPLKRARGPV